MAKASFSGHIGPGGAMHGVMGQVLQKVNNDTDALRPFMGPDGRTYVRRFKGFNGKKREYEAVPVFNTTSTLPYLGYLKIDSTLKEAAYAQMTAWNDLKNAAKYSYNALGNPILMTQRISHYGQAQLSMDPARFGPTDKPTADTVLLPMPILTVDFQATWREKAVQDAAGMNMDTRDVVEAGRVAGNLMEDLTLGLGAVYSFGGASVYGYLNWPARLTYTMVDPSTAGWDPNDTLTDFLAIKRIFQDNNKSGPFMVYNSPDWEEVLDNDYSSAYGGITLRERLKKLSKITDIKTAERMPAGYKMIWVQFGQSDSRAVIGFNWRTLRFSEMGGMIDNFRGMFCGVPQLQDDMDDQCGVMECSAA